MVETLTNQEREFLNLMKQRTKTFKRFITPYVIIMSIIVYSAYYLPKVRILCTVVGIIIVLFGSAQSRRIFWAKCPRCKKFFYGHFFFAKELHPFKWSNSWHKTECFYCHLKDKESLGGKIN